MRKAAVLFAAIAVMCGLSSCGGGEDEGVAVLYRTVTNGGGFSAFAATTDEYIGMYGDHEAVYVTREGYAVYIKLDDSGFPERLVNQDGSYFTVARKDGSTATITLFSADGQTIGSTTATIPSGLLAGKEKVLAGAQTDAAMQTSFDLKMAALTAKWVGVAWSALTTPLSGGTGVLWTTVAAASAICATIEAATGNEIAGEISEALDLSQWKDVADVIVPRNPIDRPVAIMNLIIGAGEWVFGKVGEWMATTTSEGGASLSGYYSGTITFTVTVSSSAGTSISQSRTGPISFLVDKNGVIKAGLPPGVTQNGNTFTYTRTLGGAIPGGTVTITETIDGTIADGVISGMWNVDGRGTATIGGITVTTLIITRGPFTANRVGDYDDYSNVQVPVVTAPTGGF